MYRDYSPKGVRFFYLYKALAHPELHGYVKPVTLEERLMHVKEAERTLGSRIPWLCDTMSNDLKHAIGNAPNSEYILDPQGKIVVKRGWSNVQALRKDLARLVGAADPPTTVADLNMPTAKPPLAAPTGVVPRPKLPGPMKALKITPQLDKTEHPFYVKARIEAAPEVLEQGKGMLYLGFHLDPLYGVHWNNLVAPVEFEMFPPDGAIVSPSKASGPKVKAESDVDPREFLLAVDRGASDEPMRMSFRYFACTETMCMPLTQEYLIDWDADPDGGGAIRRPRGPTGETLRRQPNPQSSRSRGDSGGPGGAFVTRMMARDADGDGKIAESELPAQMRGRFARMDADGDGFADVKELEQVQKRIQAGQR